MRRTGRLLLVGAVALSLGVAGTVYAYAGGWTVTSAPTRFTAKVVKMPRGVEPSVTKQSGQAVVSWSAQEIAPGVRMDHYLVVAHSVAEPPQPDVTRAVAAGGSTTESVTFGTGEMAGGKWRWTITPKYREWTGEPSKLSPRLAFPAAPAAPADPAVIAAPAVPPASPSVSAPTPEAGDTSTAPVPDVRTSPASEPENVPAPPRSSTPVEEEPDLGPDPSVSASPEGPTSPVAP
ncbi:hypothetical protein [Actinoplanes palleronii]|uniref:hypothetical protein n=1 Tax=Actinoplanes palleronii TaxID=113570 RepID=UPI001941C3B7|nr:hypothetical protein [Actinoplanes palleronii]